jgi:hypothetical protein
MTVMNIDVNIPVPASRRKYPYRDMSVGDSFLVVGASVQVICNANNRAGKKLGWRFIARRVPDGVRVWRVS